MILQVNPSQNSSIRMALFALLLATFLQACGDGKRYHDEQTVANKREAARSAATGLQAILDFQERQNTDFADPDISPLRGEAFTRFTGLVFFPADTTYQVWAKLSLSPEALPFEMPTTTERMAMERIYGILSFELKGQSYELEVYQSPELMMQEGFEDYLFLPFTDRTNGGTTYEGGRYMDLRIPKGDSLLLDFNKAYTPYCAYNPDYSCPIVPSVNHLDTEVLAGIKAYRPNENP